MSSEPVSLQRVAPQRLERICRLLILDTFRHHFQREIVREVDNGLDDVVILGMLQHAGDKGTIDLQLVDGQIPIEQKAGFAIDAHRVQRK